jgi:diacylglycerol O-acyltransferase
MEAAYPYVPIGGNTRIGVAMFSYRDQLTVGVTADYATVPDIHVLADGIERGLSELACERACRSRASG